MSGSTITIIHPAIHCSIRSSSAENYESGDVSEHSSRQLLMIRPNSLTLPCLVRPPTNTLPTTADRCIMNHSRYSVRPLLMQSFSQSVYCRFEVMTRLMVDALSELCFLFLKGGNFAFIAAIASGLFPQTDYQSFE